ncbi:hypothetical protein D3C75_1105920 [compost metagenome]
MSERCSFRGASGAGSINNRGNVLRYDGGRLYGVDHLLVICITEHQLPIGQRHHMALFHGVQRRHPRLTVGIVKNRLGINTGQDDMAVLRF